MGKVNRLFWSRWLLSVIRVSKIKKFFVLVWRHRAAYRRGIRPWTPPAHLFSGQDRLRRLRDVSTSVGVLGFIFRAVYKDFT
jgi:hypothetical protein